MANAYLDLGTWWCLTPYIGAGFGGAYNRITGVQDTGINPTAPSASADLGRRGNWNFAWNAQAGLTYNVTNNFKVDLTVRYLTGLAGDRLVPVRIHRPAPAPPTI